MRNFRNNLVLSLIVFVLSLSMGDAVSVSFAADGCVECHKDEKFRVQNKMIYDYYKNWKDSLHELAGVSCADCHGGDAAQAEKDRAHKKNFSPLTAVDKSSFKVIPDRCGKCHESVLNNFTASKHYKALLEKGIGPHCVTCHGSMNAEVYYTSVVARACRECHNEYTKNRPEIAGEADKILHRINVSRALKNWVSLHYAEKEAERAEEVITRYQDIAESWHKFDFQALDDKSENLLSQLKSMVNRKLAEKGMIKKN